MSGIASRLTCPSSRNCFTRARGHSTCTTSSWIGLAHSDQSAATKQIVWIIGISSGETPSAPRTQPRPASAFRDQLGFVPSSDVEPVVGGEETAAVASLDTALVVLCVDHEDAVGSDDDVVDVRARPRHPAVVQHGEALLAERVEDVPEGALAVRAIPHAFVECGSSLSARTTPASFPYRLRTACSRLSWRRVHSRAADAPASPRSISGPSTGASTGGTSATPGSPLSAGSGSSRKKLLRSAQPLSVSCGRPIGALSGPRRDDGIDGLAVR